MAAPPDYGYGGGEFQDNYGGYGAPPAGYAAAQQQSNAPAGGYPGGGDPGAPPQLSSNYGYGGHGGPGGGYGGMMASPLDAEIQVVIREMYGELNALEAAGEYGEQYKNAKRLLGAEVNKLENNIDPEWLEVDIDKPIKVTKKVLIPSFRHHRFNFVGKVLGPKGQTLQNIVKTYKCHVYILGRGSSRDRAKEQELLAGGDPQFAHYGGPLHVKIETTAAPAIAYQRVAGVLACLADILQPVKDTHIDGITVPLEEGPKPEDGEGPGAGNGDQSGNGDDAGGGFRGGRGGGFRGYGGGPMRGPPRGGGPMRGFGPPGFRGRGGPFRGRGAPSFQPY